MWQKYSSRWNHKFEFSARYRSASFTIGKQNRPSGFKRTDKVSRRWTGAWREFPSWPVGSICTFATCPLSAILPLRDLRPRFGPIVRSTFQDAAGSFNENFNYPIPRLLETCRRNVAIRTIREAIALAQVASKSRDWAFVPVSRATKKFDYDIR